ncbi:unnamed protein product [Orchesella dallaii]
MYALVVGAIGVGIWWWSNHNGREILGRFWNPRPGSPPPPLHPQADVHIDDLLNFEPPRQRADPDPSPRRYPARNRVKPDRYVP